MNNEEEKGIPSPFTPEDFHVLETELLDKIHKLAKEYGYEDIFVLAHKRNEITESCMWFPASTVLSDCLVQSLESAKDDIENDLENKKK